MSKHAPLHYFFQNTWNAFAVQYGYPQCIITHKDKRVIHKRIKAQADYVSRIEKEWLTIHLVSDGKNIHGSPLQFKDFISAYTALHAHTKAGSL